MTVRDERERLAALLAEYEAWATGEVSEISDEAMRAGSPKYRQTIRAPNGCESPSADCQCNDCAYDRIAREDGGPITPTGGAGGRR